MAVESINPSLKSRLTRAARSLGVRLSCTLQDATRPRVLVFPSYGLDDGASRLRAWCVAAELREWGWRAAVVPPQLTLEQRRHLIDREQPSVLLLQQGRHPLNRPALYRQSGARVVFDLDDADWMDPQRTADLEACCRDADAVIAGSRFVAAWCRQFNKNTSVVWTGTPMPASRHGAPPFPPAKSRRPIVTWAQADPMGCPLEGQFVMQAMLDLARRGTRFAFRLYGARPDTSAAFDAYLAPLRGAGVTCDALPLMEYDRFVGSLGEVAVGLQLIAAENSYGKGKSFGKVLAYVAAGCPVVVSDAADYALFFRDGQNGLLVADRVGDWSRAVESLLNDADLRQRLAHRAYTDAQSKLSSGAAAGAVDLVLREAARRVVGSRSGITVVGGEAEPSARREDEARCCPVL